MLLAGLSAIAVAGTRLIAANVVADTPYSRLESDETVVFFQTTGALDEITGTWQLPIHGWVYEPENSIVRKAVIASALSAKYGLRATPDTAANFDSRVNLMIAENERGKRIVVRIGELHFEMPKSGANGHFRTNIELPADVVAAAQSDGVLKITATTEGEPRRTFEGFVQLVPPVGISVISDVDDTIKVSDVTDHRRLFEHTFFLDFTAVPGMAEVYSKWADGGVSVHFVSSSPWQLYTPLQQLALDAGFPSSSFSLKTVRFKDRTFFNLFKKGTATKPRQIEEILERYPQRKFVLIGDSGEQDPEVYAGIMRNHPQQILCVYIRNVTDASEDDERMRRVFEGLAPDKWKLFSDPAALALPSE